MFQSNVATDVCVSAGIGGAAIRHSRGGGAGVRIVDRDISDTLDILDTPPGELRPPPPVVPPPILEGVGLL